MAQTMTAPEIKARLKDEIERSDACRGARFEITVRRVETGKAKKPTTKWYADIRPIKGKPDDEEACEQAVMDIIQRLQEELELALDP